MICKASRCLLLNCCPAACGDMCLNLQDFQDAVESSTVDIYIYIHPTQSIKGPCSIFLSSPWSVWFKLFRQSQTMSKCWSSSSRSGCTDVLLGSTDQGPMEQRWIECKDAAFTALNLAQVAAVPSGESVALFAKRQLLGDLFDASSRASSDCFCCLYILLMIVLTCIGYSLWLLVTSEASVPPAKLQLM